MCGQQDVRWRLPQAAQETDLILADCRVRSATAWRAWK